LEPVALVDLADAIEHAPRRLELAGAAIGEPARQARLHAVGFCIAHRSLTRGRSAGMSSRSAKGKRTPANRVSGWIFPPIELQPVDELLRCPRRHGLRDAAS